MEIVKKSILSQILFHPIFSYSLWGTKISAMICRPHFLLLGSTAHNHQDLSRDTYDLDEPVTSKALPLPPQAPAPFQTASLTVGKGPCALGVPGWNKTTKQNKNVFLYYQDEYIKISSQKTVRSCQVTRKSSPCFISRELKADGLTEAWTRLWQHHSW